MAQEAVGYETKKTRLVDTSNISQSSWLELTMLNRFSLKIEVDCANETKWQEDARDIKQNSSLRLGLANLFSVKCGRYCRLGNQEKQTM